MRGNSTILLGALNERNKASVCVSNVCDTKKTADISKIGNITYENNATAYKIKFLFTIIMALCLTLIGGKMFAQQSLPYTYGFENNDLSADGWTTVNESTNNVGDFGIAINAKRTGDYGFRFSSYSSSSSYNQYLISPELNAVSGLIFKFYYANSSSSGTETFKVGYSTTDNDVSSFTFGSEISTSSTSWTLSEEYSFPAGTKYVAIYYYSNYQYRLYVDDLTFANPPSCPQISSLTASNITSSSANISWTEGGSATAWVLKYGPAGFNVETEGTTQNISTTPAFEITGLSANTQFDVYVKAICGVGDESSWGKVTFRTECGAESVPWSEDFENRASIAALPCWTKVGEGSVSVNNGNANSGSYSLKFSGVTGGNIIALPQFGSEISGLQLSFYTRPESHTNSSCGTFEVGYITDLNDASTFVSVESYAYNDWASASYTHKEVIMSSAPAGSYFAFNHNAGSSSWYWFVDDVSVNLAPACITPNNLVCSSVTSNSAIISWAAGDTETTWDLRYMNNSEASPHWTDVEGLTSNNSYLLVGLDQNSEYSVQVRADCGTDGTSEWTQLVTFTTLEACPKTSGLMRTGLTATTATFRWLENGSATAWQLCLNDNESSPIDVTENPYTITGLNPETSYTIKLRANCGEGVFSDWTNNASFTTLEACPAPTGLICTAYTATTATLAWTAVGSATDWILQYGTDNTFADGTYTEVSVSTAPTKNLTGLTAETTYYARVKADCGTEGESDWSNVVNFMPSATIVIGSGTATNNNLPTYTYYNYSLTQQIFTPAEIGNNAGTILSIDFFANSAVTRDMDVYMVATNKGTFSGGSDWIPVSSGDLVFSGPVSFTANDWTSITLTNSFIYDGIQNVAIIVDDNTGSYENNRNFRVFNATSQAIRVYSDGTNYDPADPSSYTGTVLNVKNQIRLHMGDLPSCVRPSSLAASNITTTTADLSWVKIGSETAWQICLNDNESSPIDVTENPYTITGLNPDTDYTIKLRANCGSEYSEWTNEITFRTIPSCFVPTALAVSNVDYNTANLDWTEGDTETAWQICINDDVNSIIDVTEKSYILTGLDDGKTYSVKVRANCGVGDYSNWCTSQSFTTKQIPVVVGSGWSDDFEGTTNWMLVNGALPNAWVVGSALNNGGSNSLYISNDGGTTNAYSNNSASITYATKIFTFENTQYTFKYDWKANGESTNDYLRVALVPSNTTIQAMTMAPPMFSASSLPSGWIALDGGSKLNLVSTWQADKTVVADVPAGNYLVVFAWRNDGNSGAQTPAAIDNFSITPVSCVSPSTLHIEDLTSTTSIVSWTKRGEESAWILKYGEAGFDVETEGTTENISGTPEFQMTALTENTSYDVYVKADCGGGDASEWIMITFKTPCANLTVPYTENFETYDANTVLDCWDNSASTTTSISNNPAYVWGVYSYGGNKMLRMHNYYVKSGTALINSQPISIPSTGQYQLTFDYSHTASCGDFIVKISQDGGSSFVDLASYAKVGTSTSYTDPGDFTEATISLAAYAGRTIILQFFANADYSSGAIFIDNVSIDFIPDCDKPTDVTVDDVAITTATISWTAGGNEDTWNIEYKTDSDPDWTEISNVTTPYTIEDLNPETNYEVRVQANCRGNIGVSNWSRAASFTTLPNCPAPTNLSASVTSTSATVSWTAGFEENVWNLRYRVVNTVVWTDVNGVSNPYTIENLTAETAYEVQVQSKCTPMVSSVWTDSYYFYTGYCAPAPTSRDGKGIIGVSFGVGNEVVNNTAANGLPAAAPYYGNYSNLVGAANIGLETTVSINYATGYTYGTIIWIDFHDNLEFDGNEVVYVGESERTNPTVLEATFSLPASTPLGEHRMRILGSDSGYDNYITSISDAADADPCPTGTYTVVHDYTIRVLDIPSCLPPTNIEATNITTAGTTISWTENSNATDWELQYSTERDFSSYETINASTNPTADISGLTDATVYYVRVKANCGGEFSYWSTTASFITACGVFTVDADHQFTENFTGITTETFPPICWSQERTDEGTGSGYDYADGAWDCYTSTQGTGSNPPMAQLRSSKVGSKHNLVTKALSMVAGDYMVSLKVYRNASNYSEEGINVYLSKTNDLVSAGNDAVDLGFISRNYTIESVVNSNIIGAETSAGWYKYEIPVTVADDGVYYVIFEGRSQNGGTTYMDDVVVKVAPTCAKPTNLIITDRGLNDVTLEWTAGDAETTWNLQYKKVSDQAWTTINGITSTTYTVTGLLAATSYEFQVQADCGGDYSEWTDAVSITTKYGIVFLEQFASTLPADWNQYTGHLSNVMNGTATLESANNWIFNSGNGVFDDHARVNIYGGSCFKWLTTPVIIMKPNVQLTFDLALTAYSGTLQPAATTGLDDKFVVLISTDEGATWTVLRQYDNVGSAYVYNNISLEGEEVAIDLSSYGTDEVIIAFYGESTESNADNNLHIDNVMLDYIPTCLKPTGLAVVATTTTSATIEWTPAGAEPAKWQYRLNDGAWTDLAGVTGTAIRTATITGLTEATAYTIEVRAYCSDSFNDQSRPSTAVSFHTALCDGGDMCEIRYELTDSGNDGWEGNAINVVDALTGIVLDTWTIADGEASAEGTLSVCNGRQISFEWENGNSAGDCSYIVYDRNDEEIFSGEGAIDNIISYTVNCDVVTCRKPRSLTVSNVTATTAQISWVPNGNFTTWQYSIDGGANWTDVSGVTHINLTGLTSGVNYTVLLRTNCGSEQSEARSVSFVTGDMCEISYELTDSYGDGWNGAAINVVDGMTGTILATWTIGSGRSASGTLPIIDGSTVNFVWVRGNYDSECSYVVNDVSGNTIFAGSAAMSPIAHVVDCPDCVRPRNLEASDVTTTSAMISWEAGSATDWTIQYSNSSTFSTVLGSEDVNVPQKEFTGLTAETTYYFRVKAVCGVGEESDWSNVCEVTPSVCRRIGSGVAVNADLPAQSYYNYSYSQQIYTPAEIGSAGLLNGISFYNNGTAQTRTIDMYVVPTTKSTFSSTTDWIPVTAEDLVYSGTVTFANGQWTQIDFTNAIEYDGTKNIAVIVDDNTGSYQSAMSCLAFNAAGNQALHARNDNSNYDPENASFAGTLSSAKNQARFCITGCEDRSGNLTFIGTPARINVGGSVNISSNTYLTNTASPSGTIQWSSSDTRIATVNSEGVVTGLSAGKAIITATLPSVFDGLTLYCAMQAEYAVVVDCNNLVNPDCFDFEDYASANDLYYEDAGIPSCWRRIYTGTYAEGAPHAYNGYFAMDGNAIEITSGNYQLYGQNYGHTNYVVMPYISGMENGGMVTFNAWWQYVDYGTLTVGYMTDPDDAATFVAVGNATPFLYNFGSATAGLNQISLPSMPASAYIAFRWVCETDYFSYSVAIDNVCICSAVAGAFGLTQTSGTVLVTQTFDDLSSFINNETNVAGTITYSTSNPTVAIVDENGIITGTSVGEATITVTFTPNEPGKCPRTADFVVIVGSEACKEIGDATTTTYKAPVNNKYNYTYTQILFRHDEINATGLITSISFQYAYNRPMTAKNSVKMYLKETDKEEFSGTNDWVLGVTEDDLVYSGALNCSQGWNSYFLDEPFPYNGNNLLLVIDDNSANNNGESYVFDYTETSFNSVISYYNDNNNYGNNNISGHSRLCERTRPNTKFCIYEGSACTIVYDASTNCMNESGETGVSNTIESTHGVTGYPAFVTSDIPSCSLGLFLGWDTNPTPDQTDPSYEPPYAPGAYIASARDMTLYAIYRICDYVKIVKEGNAQQGISDGGTDRFGIQKFNVCEGEVLTLEAQKKPNVHDNVNITYQWDVNRHDGHAHVTSNTSTVTYEATTTMGHDILLKIDGHDGCKQEIPLRVWVSHGLRTTYDNPSAGNICVGYGKEIVVGDPRIVQEPIIEVANEALEIKSTQGVSNPKFIPDGVGECYTSDVEFADFKENAVITDASNIDYVKINLEHSHIGDVQISLKCYTPNYEPRTAILLQDQKNSAGGGLDNATYAWPYVVVRCYASFDRYINDQYSSGGCQQGRLDRQNVSMAVYVGYNGTSTGIRQEGRAFDKNMTIAELLAELRAMLNSTATNTPADFCAGGYYYKFRGWVNNNPANYYSTSSYRYGGYGSNYTTQWYTEAASLGFGKPDMHDGLSNYILTSSYNPSGEGFDYCWSNSDSYQYAAADGSPIDNANHERGITNALIVKPSNASNGTQFYHPYQSFQSLVGCKLNGVWTIQICDSWGLDNGYIFNWEIGLKDIDDNAWSYDIELVDSHMGNCGGFDSNNAGNIENLISEEGGTPNFYIHPTIANMESNGITLPAYPASLTRSCELTLVDNIGCETTGNSFTYDISQPAIPYINSPEICLGEQAHVQANLGGSGMEPGSQSMFKWWTLPYGETDWVPLTDQGVTNPVNGETAAEFYYIPARSGDRFRAEIYDAHGCGGIIDDIIITNLPDIASSTVYDYVWHGKYLNTTSNDWNIATNWYVNNGGGSYSVGSTSLPTIDDNVYIGTSECTKTKNLTLSNNAYAKTLTIGSDASLTVTAGTALSIAGDLENIGTLNANEVAAGGESYVFFVGSDNQSISEAQTFRNVQFMQSGTGIHNITADNGITVDHSATFTNGILTGNATFNENATATVSNYKSYVDGTVVKKGNTDLFTFPTGNDGVLGSFTTKIENNTASGMSIKFNHKHGDTDESGFSSEAPDYYPEWWTANSMCSDNDPQLDHVSNFEYWKVDGVDDGVNLSNITLKVDADHPTQHFHDGVTDYSATHIVAAAHYDCWKNLGPVSTTVTGSHSTITIRNINTIPRTRGGAFDGIVTLGSIDRATLLPIELQSFAANCDGKSVLVEWTTASERNNDYFIIERSDDAINFVEIARVAGAGNSIEQLDYSYADYGKRNGDNYYRLIQVDYDGMRSISEIVVVFCADETGEEPEVLAYPNPFNDDLNIELDNFGDRPAQIDVFDMLGKLVYTESVESPQNSYNTVLQLGGLPTSTYNVRVSTSDFVINRKVVKN